MKHRILVRLALVATAATVMVTAAGPAFATSPLPAPTNLVAVHVSDTAADLSWNGSGLTAGDVVERQDHGVWRQYATGLYGSLALTNLSPATRYTFRVYSIPVAGIGYTNSPPSAPVSFTTLAGPDTVPPSKPTAPSFSSVTTTAVNVSWPEATDNVQVTGYNLQQLIAGAWTTIRTVDAAARFQTVSGLSPATSYQFAVIAFDARGNLSARSDPGTVTMLAATATLTCHAQITVYGTTNFQAIVTVLNSTTASVSGWTVGFTLATSATTSSVFNAALTRSGSTGTLTPLSYDTVLTPGVQITVGFLGSGAAPGGFTGNGLPCSVG